MLRHSRSYAQCLWMLSSNHFQTSPWLTDPSHFSAFPMVWSSSFPRSLWLEETAGCQVAAPRQMFCSFLCKRTRICLLGYKACLLLLGKWHAESNALQISGFMTGLHNAIMLVHRLNRTFLFVLWNYWVFLTKVNLSKLHYFSFLFFFSSVDDYDLCWLTYKIVNHCSCNIIYI